MLYVLSVNNDIQTIITAYTNRVALLLIVCIVKDSFVNVNYACPFLSVFFDALNAFSLTIKSDAFSNRSGDFSSAEYCGGT